MMALFDDKETTPADEARRAIDRGVFDIVKLEHGDAGFSVRPSFPGSSFTRRVPEPMAALKAAIVLRNQAAGEVDRQIREARSKGSTWAGIAVVLGITEEDDKGNSPAEQAFFVAAPEPTGWSFRPSTTSWRCSTCDEYVTDRGPFETHPDDNESGHAETCSRHRAAIAAWRKRVGDD